MRISNYQDRSGWVSPNSSSIGTSILHHQQKRKYKDKYSQERNIKELMLKTSESGFNYPKIRIAPAQKRKEESKNSIKNILQMVQNYQEKQKTQKQKEYTSFNPIKGSIELELLPLGLHRKIHSTYQTYQTTIQDNNEILNESKKININQQQVLSPKENSVNKSIRNSQDISVYKDTFIDYTKHPLNSSQKLNQSQQNQRMYRDSGYFLSPTIQARKIQLNLENQKPSEQQQFQIVKQILPTRQTDVLKLKSLLSPINKNDSKENTIIKVNEIKPQILKEQLFLNQKYKQKRRHPSDQTFSFA